MGKGAGRGQVPIDEEGGCQPTAHCSLFRTGGRILRRRLLRGFHPLVPLPHLGPSEPLSAGPGARGCRPRADRPLPALQVGIFAPGSVWSRGGEDSAPRVQPAGRDAARAAALSAPTLGTGLSRSGRRAEWRRRRRRRGCARGSFPELPPGGGPRAELSAGLRGPLAHGARGCGASSWPRLGSGCPGRLPAGEDVLLRGSEPPSPGPWWARLRGPGFGPSCGWMQSAGVLEYDQRSNLNSRSHGRKLWAAAPGGRAAPTPGPSRSCPTEERTGDL